VPQSTYRKIIIYNSIYKLNHQELKLIKIFLIHTHTHAHYLHTLTWSYQSSRLGVIWSLCWRVWETLHLQNPFCVGHNYVKLWAPPSWFRSSWRFYRSKLFISIEVLGWLSVQSSGLLSVAIGLSVQIGKVAALEPATHLDMNANKFRRCLESKIVCPARGHYIELSRHRAIKAVVCFLVRIVC